MDRPLLILGASGFLGAHLVGAAGGTGAPVVAACRRPERRPRGAGETPKIEDRCLDAADPAALTALLGELQPAAVINAAALARVGDCERDPQAATALNEDLPARLSDLIVKSGSRLVHVSTDLVFGGAEPRGERFDEQDEAASILVYGRTKAAGEQAALAAGGDVLVVRLPLLYGDSLGRGLGASDQILEALARGERPGLFTDEHRTPLDVADAAAALVELAGRAERGLLHVAGPLRLDRHALGLLVLEAAGHPCECVDATTREARGLGERPSDVSLDATRARRMLETPLRAPAEALLGRSA